MKRILRIINRFNLGGPTYNAAYLTKYLTDGYETLLVGGQKEDDEESSEFILQNLGITPVIIPEMHRAIRPVDDVIALQKIKKIIRQYKPDIVHTHAAKAGMLGRQAAFDLHVPVVVHTFHGHVFHSYFNPLKTRMFVGIERYLARRSAGIIAISDIQKEELGNIFKIAPLSKISVIPLGFDLARFQVDQDTKRRAFRKEYSIGDEELAIGIIGRLAPVKNHSLFIRSFAMARQRTTKRIRGLIIGDGNLKDSLMAQCRELNLTVSFRGDGNSGSDIQFCSWIKDIDVACAGLDLVAMTSFNEGTPVSLIEAQAAGTPVVTTNVGGIGNIVIPNQTALLSNVADENLFAQNILRLIENENLREEFSRKGPAFVMNRFHYSRLVNDMSAYYQGLM